MAIESAAIFRRFVRTECLGLLLVLIVCGAAFAQTPVVPAVVSGSLMPLEHTQTGQIYSIVIASTGDVLFLDTSQGGLYGLKPDGKTFVTLSAPGVVLNQGGFQNAGMTIDSNNTIYITDRWDGTVMYRVPYENGTWSLSSSSNSWIVPLNLKSSCDVRVDPTDGSLIFSRETPDVSIMRLTFNADGSPKEATYILKGLKDRAAKMTVDRSGNIYFIEEPWIDPSVRKEGVFRVPKGTIIENGDGSGSVEDQLTRVDPPNVGDFNGVSVDNNGNVYLTAQVNSQYNELYDMVVLVPNENGTPNPQHASIIAPVSAAANLTIDPRGFLWIPVGTNGWDGMAGTYNFIKWFMGSAEVPAAEVGTTGTETVRVYYGFNAETTPANFAFTEASGGSDFAIVPNDPPASGECVLGTTYHQWEGCYVRVALKPTIAGDISGQLQMLDSTKHVLASTYIHGVGQASAVAVLTSAAETEIGSGLSGQKQLAADTQGNIYVADSTSGRVLKFAKGSISSPTSIGTGLSAPSGVAVDGNGTVYIADAGKIIRVPYQSGSYGTQSTVQTGLGTNVKLATDGAGNVYAADPTKSRVLKIINSSTAIVMSGNTAVTVGSGFSTPSNLASDSAGNLVVADGSNLILLPAIGGKIPVANGIAGINGLAIDASGSIYMAQADGLRRIPSVPGGGYSPNDTAVLSPNMVSSPTAVAVDSAGNVYASQGNSITRLSFNGDVNFNDRGVVVPNLEAPAQIQLFNIGNLPLTLAPFSENVFSDPTTFEIIGSDDSPNCDPATPVEAGAYCWMGLGMTAATAADYSATLSVNSDAANAAPLKVDVKGTAVADDRPATQVNIKTAFTKADYPATAVVTVTVTSESGTPTGNVTVAVSGQEKRTTLLENGVASFTYENLAGSPSSVPETPYTVRASYGGDGDSFAASGSTAKFTVTRAASKNTATATFAYLNFVKVGSNFILTATVTSDVGKPTGKVRFVEGSDQHLSDPAQPFVTLDANGQATFNTHNLDVQHGVTPGAVMTHVITAVYDGDTNFAPASAQPITVQIVNPSVYVITSGASFSISPGTPVTQTLKLRPIEDFDAAVDLLCTNLPQYTECTFDNPHISVGKDEHGAIMEIPIQVTISTNVPVNVGANLQPHSNSSAWFFASLFGFGLVGLVTGKKTKYSGRMLMFLCALLVITGAVAGMSACGNTGYSKTPPAPHVTTPSGSYNVSIVAMDATTRTNVAVPNAFTVTVK